MLGSGFLLQLAEVRGKVTWSKYPQPDVVGPLLYKILPADGQIARQTDSQTIDTEEVLVSFKTMPNV